MLGFPVLQIVNSEYSHSVAYTLARGDSKVVEYTRDTTSDMFQVTPLFKSGVLSNLIYYSCENIALRTAMFALLICNVYLPDWEK